MRKMLVIGATGLVGRRLTRTLLEEGFAVRCSTRDPERARARLPDAAEIVRGDLADAASMDEAVRGVEAVFDCAHTLSPQPGAAAGASFVDTELDGLRSLVAACRAHGVRRVLYVTFLGTSPEGGTAWSRGRWQAERMLIESGLDATVLRPGQIVGKGGYGFDRMMAQAARRITLVLGSGKARRQNIALDDLVRCLVRSLDEPRTFGEAFDVGSDDVLTGDEMIDVAASVLGKSAPWKIHVQGSRLAPFAGLIEGASGLPRGAFRDLLMGMETDLVGDTGPIRAIFPEPPLRYREAIERALRG